MKKSVDFHIDLKTVSISFECPYCDYDVTVDWGDLNVPYYWGDDWGEIECPHCGKTVELGDYEYD